MSIDLYGGSLEIYFKSKNGKARTLKSIVFGESTNVQDVSYVNFVERFSVKISIVRMTQMSITLNPPFEQAVKLIQSGVLGLGFGAETSDGKGSSSSPDLATSSSTSFNFNSVVVRIHYGGNVSPYFKGILVTPEFDIGVEGISITLKAVGMLFEQTKISLKQSFEAQSRIDILNKLLGNQYELIQSQSDSKCQEAMATIDKLTVAESNMSVIQKLLDKSNCVLVEKGTITPNGKPVLELLSKDHMRKKKDTPVSFVIWNDIDPNHGIYPILSLKTSIVNVLAGQSFGLNMMSVDTSTKKTTDPKSSSTVGSDPTATVNSSHDGSKSGAISSSSDFISNLLNKVGPDRGEKQSLKDTLLGTLAKATDTTFQYHLDTPGLPHLLPGRTVTVRVANIKFLSGAYDLYEVEHVFSIDGVTTSLTLARTGGLANMIDQGVQKTLSVAASAAANTTGSKPAK